MFSTADTIVAIATPPGRGGIGVVRLSGPDAYQIAQCLISGSRALQPRHATLTTVRLKPGATSATVRLKPDTTYDTTTVGFDHSIADLSNARTASASASYCHAILETTTPETTTPEAT